MWPAPGKVRPIELPPQAGAALLQRHRQGRSVGMDRTGTTRTPVRYAHGRDVRGWGEDHAGATGSSTPSRGSCSRGGGGGGSLRVDRHGAERTRQADDAGGNSRRHQSDPAGLRRFVSKHGAVERGATAFQKQQLRRTSNQRGVSCSASYRPRGSQPPLPPARDLRSAQRSLQPRKT